MSEHQAGDRRNAGRPFPTSASRRPDRSAKWAADDKALDWQDPKYIRGTRENLQPPSARRTTTCHPRPDTASSSALLSVAKPRSYATCLNRSGKYSPANSASRPCRASNNEKKALLYFRGILGQSRARQRE